MSADRENYSVVAGRLLDLAVDINRQPVLKRYPPDAFAIKACIDALDQKLEKLENMAASYRAELLAA